LRQFFANLKNYKIRDFFRNRQAFYFAVGAILISSRLFLVLHASCCDCGTVRKMKHRIIR